MLTDESKSMLQSLLETIECISDKDYQRRVWIQGKGPEVNDFDESVIFFFSLGDSVLRDYKEYEVTNSQYQILKKFRDQFEEFSDNNHWPPFFIDTPEWTNITQMAKDVLKVFHHDETEELTVEQKKNILNLILYSISYISDKDYQRRVWIRGEGPEVDDFGETVCDYSGLTEDVFENYKEYGISDIQLPVIKKFHDSFRKFWFDNDWPHLFIDTPEWTEITKMAKEVLQAFDCTQEKIRLALEESREQRKKRRQALKLLLKNIGKICTEKNQGKEETLTKPDDSIHGAINDYFNSIGSILEDYRNYEISTPKLQILKKFHESFSKFWKDNEMTYLFTVSPEWGEITELGKDVLKAFHYDGMENN